MTNWQHLGAWTGGSVSSLALAPDFTKSGFALATTAAGLYRTRDGGQAWELSMRGFDDPGALAVAFAPTAPPLAFASSEQGRLYRSDDGGTAWREVVRWAGLGVITAFAFSPAYAEDRTFFVATAQGVFRTLDNGMEWQEASFGLLDLDVLCLSCAPDFAQSNVLWAGTAFGGFFRSRNGGRAWRESGAGLPDCAVQCLAVSPHFASDRTLFVGTETQGVYVSQDGGATWQPGGRGLPAISINCLTLCPQEGAAAGYRIVAGTEMGISLSDDGGASWTSSGADFLALDLAAATDGSVMAATYQEGIYVSSDAGQSWRATASEVVAHAPPLIRRTMSGGLYALDANGILASSSDGGAHWAEVSTDALASPVVALTSGVNVNQDLLYSATADGRIHRHSLHGDPWQTIDGPADDVTALASTQDARGETHLLVSDSAGQAYLRTASDGVWQTLPCPWRGHSILHLDFLPWPVMVKSLIAVTAWGNAQRNFDVCLWHLSEPGAQWDVLATLETEIPAVLTLLVASAEGRTILLATQHRLIQLYQTTDDNEWTVHQHFFESDVRVTAVAASPAADILYAATTVGIFSSTDGGEEWTTLADLPTVRPVVALLPPQVSGQPLLAVTLGGDVWSLLYAEFF